MCLYCLLQLASGHVRSPGDVLSPGVEPLLLTIVTVVPMLPVDDVLEFWLLVVLEAAVAPLELERHRLLPLDESGGTERSKSEGRPFRFKELLRSCSGLAGLGGAWKLLPPHLRPFLNLRPSLLLLLLLLLALLLLLLLLLLLFTRSLTGVAVLPRPRFPRPFGVLDSRSLTGESQLNLKERTIRIRNPAGI